MIIMRIVGGLGNQMLSYAFGRYLALKNRTELCLDLGFYTKDNHSCALRAFELSKLRTIYREADAADWNRVNHWSRPRCLFRKFLPYYKRAVVKERSWVYDKNMLEIPDFTHVKGDFACYPYWKSIETTLKSEFTLKYGYSPASNDLLRRIQSVGMSAAIHFRRGDFVTNPVVNRSHGVLDMGYYLAAMERLESRLGSGSIHYFVFSDDLEWVREHFPKKERVFFVTEDRPEYFHEHMFLMSECGHQIIANSSFSFWAGWLNPNPDKVVISPHYWVSGKFFKSGEAELPEGWIVVS